MSDSHVSKIRIKMGPIELEYEGSESFLKQELPDLLGAVSKLYTDTGGSIRSADVAADASSDGGGHPTLGNLRLTTGTIASRLQCKTGPDLVIAAAARLHFGLSNESYTRRQLLEQMQEAPTYFNENYRKNLTQNLAALVRGKKLNEVSRHKYALTPETLKELGTQLASQGLTEGSAQQA
jgi:hypothetical protein